MKPLPAVILAVLLPLLTAPWWFARGADRAWFGLPVWVVCCLAMTVLLAVLIASWMGRWWDPMAEAAERAGGEVAESDAADEGR